jgi:RNA polymerase sigma factor (sigma-70 family)
VRVYQAQTDPAERARHANELYARHLPLVLKTLHGFCKPGSCYSGGCSVEDLVGETYSAFRGALDEFDVQRGVDFLGFAARRLYWELRHRIRETRRKSPLEEGGSTDDPERPTAEEDRILDRVLIEELFTRIPSPDQRLLEFRYGQGCSCRETAEKMNLAPAAARKRLERARKRLQALVTEGPEATAGG